MAEENNETEQTAGDAEAADNPTGTVKKKAAKKNVAKKKVTKKKAASKKKAAKKQPAAPAPAADSLNREEEEHKPASTPVSQSSEPKPAAATIAAEAAPSIGEEQEKRPDSTAPNEAQTSTKSDVVIKAKFIREKPPEDSSMSTETKSAGGFWVKVIFWLLIIVLVFIYIRSLAKHPGERPSATTSEVKQEMTSKPLAPAETAFMREADSTADSNVSEKVESPQATTSGESSIQEDTVEAATGEESQASLSQPDAADTKVMTGMPIEEKTESGGQAELSASSAEESVDTTATEMPATAMPTDTTAGVGRSAGEQSLRDQHDESVAKILKEFDDLREAARVEMEAKRNLIQAERDLRDVMVPPRPPAYPPAWRAPGAGYGPYAPAPQYYPPY